MRSPLIALAACALCSVAQAAPQAVIYSTTNDPNQRLQQMNIVLWDTDWLKRTSGTPPDGYQEPTLVQLCQEQSPWFISLVNTQGNPIAPGAYYAVTLGEAGLTCTPEGATVPLPEQQVLMGIAMPSGPVIAPRGAAVVQELDAHHAKVTVAAYLPYPPNTPEAKSFSYVGTITATSCVDILAGSSSVQAE